MKHLSFLAAMLFLAIATQAKVWRINNIAGVNANFTNGQAANDNASVLNDDTLHFEGSITAYAGFNLTKRLVIIGTGYFIGGANSNTGLQANVYSANFGGGYIVFDSTSTGSVFMGLDNIGFGLGPNNGSATDNFTITRCNVSYIGQYYGYTANTKMTGWKVNKCHISALDLNGLVAQNWEVTNNIFTSTLNFNSTSNLNNLIRNNVFRGQIFIYSGYFANNIITGTTFTVTNVTIKNNTCIGVANANFAPYVGLNGNVDNQTDANIFQGLTGNSTDGQWRLKTGSQAIGTGETVSSITPDRGAFGTADPYVLSGIPPIPTIYLLTVPATVASNATTMPITISTKSNN